MNSPTHSLIALAILAKPGQTKRNWAVFLGSLIPDLFIYVCWLWLTLVDKQPQNKIWNEIYFDAPMQLTASIFNSVPLYAALAICAYFFVTSKWRIPILCFGLAALIHIAFDFPVHAHDAYAHFWPFSDWKFHSPVSYYEADHHAGWVSLIETILALTSIVVLWRRFPKNWVRFILGFFAVLYVVLQMAIRLAPLFSAG